LTEWYTAFALFDQRKNYVIGYLEDTDIKVFIHAFVATRQSGIGVLSKPIRKFERLAVRLAPSLRKGGVPFQAVECIVPDLEIQPEGQQEKQDVSQ
jgi:hypothetical protein